MLHLCKTIANPAVRASTLIPSLLSRGCYLTVVQELGHGEEPFPEFSLDTSVKGRFLYLGIKSYERDLPAVMRKVEQEWNRVIDALINFVPRAQSSSAEAADVALRSVYLSTGAVITDMMTYRLAGESRRQNPGYFDGDIQQAAEKNMGKHSSLGRKSKTKDLSLNAAPFPQMLPLPMDGGDILSKRTQHDLARPSLQSRKSSSTLDSKPSLRIDESAILKTKQADRQETEFCASPVSDISHDVSSAMFNGKKSSLLDRLRPNKNEKQPISQIKSLQELEIGTSRTYRIIHFISSRDDEPSDLMISQDVPSHVQPIIRFADRLDTQTASLGVRVFILDTTCSTGEVLSSIINGSVDPLSGSWIGQISKITDMPTVKTVSTENDRPIEATHQSPSDAKQSERKWWKKAAGKRSVTY